MQTTEITMTWIDEVVRKMSNKMDWVSDKSQDKIPYTTLNGIHDDRSSSNPSGSDADGICWWTNGFWGGMLWQMYHATGESKYREYAERTENKLDEAFEQFYGLHHDVGFMWLPTSVANYKLTGNLQSRKRALLAAQLLAGRYNPVGEFIRAWNDLPEEDTRGWAIIDCMFNIPLLYWASEETGDPRFAQIATKHADTVMNSFVRPDGSVHHIVEFDPFHGGVVQTYGGQGYADGSSWTRGQTWGLYGFMMSYNHTGKVEYLYTAKRIAHYFMASIPEDGIVPVDFRQPMEPAYQDATAAAIAACGLIEIARAVDEGEKDMYLRTAIRLLKTLDEQSTDWSHDCDCFLQNGSAAYHHLQHHQSIIYGDYYFMEAILKLKDQDLYFW
ncbi:glycoside hydrolase family 88 protein [Paenibacillus sp. WLX1005]|uniref:glycoside hydrolase family 88 protein n=1 Tax=Paenibacillus sp. WLX1005 TaxID=3243766 RepID=UPI003983F5F9